jgi:lipoprotein-anchoring transpeptidase ErfK/SrfK
MEIRGLASGMALFGLSAIAGNVAPAAAQPVYAYPPFMAPPYAERAPFRYGTRIVYDVNGNAIVVNRRGRPLYYLDAEGYPTRAYQPRYVRVVPAPYEYDTRYRPFFVNPDRSRAVPNYGVAGVQRQQTEAPPYAAPRREAALPSYSVPGQQSDAPRYAVQPQQPAREPPALPGFATPGAQPRASVEPQAPMRQAALPPVPPTDSATSRQLAPELRRQVVPYTGKEAAGTVIIDTRHTFLYFVLGHGEAMRYGIGVGREGFTWSGREKVSRMSEWPDWYPPEEMIQRQPYLPRMMAGGPGNPLGARALYLGSTLYRVHGTNDPSTIGKYVSSGCIRLTNEDIEDLYQRVHVGTQVVVLPGASTKTAASGHRTHH